jgi:hypothetical protein
MGAEFVLRANSYPATQELLAFIEADGSLSYSEEAATGPYPEPDESSPCVSAVTSLPRQQTSRADDAVSFHVILRMHLLNSSRKFIFQQRPTTEIITKGRC